MEGDPRRRLPPEDQVPAAYREIEREAYRAQRDVTPEVLASIGTRGAAGHVGDGLWHPSLLHTDSHLQTGRSDRIAANKAWQAAVAFVRSLGYRRGDGLACLQRLLRWGRGEYSSQDVADAVDEYARRPGVRYHGPIIRAITLPIGDSGLCPELRAYDPSVTRDPETTLVDGGVSSPGLIVGATYVSPVPRSFSASAAVAGNVYEVIEGPHSGASIRGFSALWAEDEVVMPAGTPLRTERIEWHRNHGVGEFAVVYLTQLDA